MKILGLNFSYDSAAALVVDGRVVAAASEERFTRRKHDRDFPTRAVDYCLGAGGVALSDVDAVGFFWNAGIHAEPFDARMSTMPRGPLEFLYNVPNHLMRRFDGRGVQRVDQCLLLDNGSQLKIHYLTHHLCHAATALFLSPFEETAILTADGYGEQTSTLIAHGKGREITPLLEVKFPHSLGSFYAAFTQYLGFRANNGEGKVMGLASYGRPTFVELVDPLITLTDNGFEVDLSYFEYFQMRRRRYSDKLVALLGPERRSDEPVTERHEDIAFALQKTLEKALVHLARLAKQRTGSSNIALAGGVGLNCVANTLVIDGCGFDRAFIVPASGDNGAALGAALWVSHCLNDVPRSDAPCSDYLGPSFSAAEIERELRRGAVPFTRLDDAPTHAARQIASGRIVGWFQGQMEFGPRALGNRSILADPRNPEMKEILNARVKFREPFRPFAPSILAERCGEYFDCATPSPFMLRVYQTRADKLDVLASVTHVDGGARVQTVSETQNPRYYALISAFERETGVPVVLNTSFNIRGEPIVCTVSDALKCFFTTDMDLLYLGDFLVEKSARRDE